MASGVIPSEGKRVLQRMIWENYNPTLKLRVFKSNTTPTNASVYSDFTWATFTGSTALTLARDVTWTITSATPSVSSYPQQTFTSSDAVAETEYGWAITDDTNALIMVMRFDSALSISSSTPSIKITPSIPLTAAA